jgi:hypothetical protein
MVGGSMRRAVVFFGSEHGQSLAKARLVVTTIKVRSTHRASLQGENGETFQGDDSSLAAPLKELRTESSLAPVAGQADHP